MKPSIFISYANEDKDFIEMLFNALMRTKAFTIWQDNLGIRAGDKLNDKIDEAIEQSDITLFYLSEASITSKWVIKEHKTALSKKNHIIYYFLDSEQTRTSLKKWKNLQYNSFRIPVINANSFYEPLLELVSTLLSKYHEDMYPNIDSEEILKASSIKGISYLQQGRFTIKDDEKLDRLIQNASSIKLMVFNANRFLDIFKEPITSFFKKKNANLKVLLADEESVFYNENSLLVSSQFENNERNKAMVPFAVDRAIAIYKNSLNNPFEISRHLEVKKFNTQFRLPIIIFDDQVCHLTINLPPSESSDGMTLELVNDSHKSYINTCIQHFDAVWSKAKSVSVDLI